MTKEMNSNLQNFPKKWAKVLDNLAEDDKFLETAQQLSKADLDKIIVTCNERTAELKKLLDLDQDLAEKKEAVKEAASGYKEGLAVNEAKAMYCVYLKNSL